MNKDIVIKVCTGTGGMAAGGEQVLETFRNLIKSSGIKGDLEERCSIHKVGCRGFCSKDVLVDVIVNGEKTTYKYVKPEMVTKF